MPQDNAARQTAQAGSKEIPLCGTCGSDRVVRDAWATWNASTQEWELQEVFDYAFCHACECECRLEWTPCPTESCIEKIRRLNDALRTGESQDGTILITSGVQAAGPAFVAAARKAVAEFGDFNGDNDPHGEHDFGVMTVAGEKLFFKTDYFDLAMTMHSPDPADPAVTRRVLTIMRADEY